MLDRVILLTEHESLDEVLRESKIYLQQNPRVLSQIGNLFYSLYTMSDIYESGCSIPLNEAYHDLESSYHFALRGFYTHAFRILRSTLELSIASIYFEDKHEEFCQWLSSSAKTPRFSVMIESIFDHITFRALDSSFGVKEELLNLYEELNKYIHSRGISYFTRSLNKSNVNRFIEESLKKYLELTERLVLNILLVLLTYFPHAFVEIPWNFEEEFVGGFLMGDAKLAIDSILNEEHRNFFQNLVRNDSNAQSFSEFVSRYSDVE